MVKVIIVNGMPGAGKTLYEQYCIQALEKSKKGIGVIRSSVDYVKEVAKYCGWDGGKTLKNRKFLSDLKRILAEWNDSPFWSVKEYATLLAEDKNNYVLFVDSREPAEIERFKRELNAFTLLIRRPSIESNETSNISDAGVFDYDYDLTVWNEYGEEEFKMMAEYFIENYLKRIENYEYVD